MTLLLDWVIAAAIAEGLALLAYHRLTGRGLAPRALLPNLLAGACLLAAARTVAGGAGWEWVAGWLLAGLGAHVVDLQARWRGALPTYPR